VALDQVAVAIWLEFSRGELPGRFALSRKFFFAPVLPYLRLKLRYGLMANNSKNSTANAPQRGEFIATVVAQQPFGTEYRYLLLELIGRGGGVFAGAKAGQFVQLACRSLEEVRSSGPLLRRPLSIAGISDKGQAIRLEIIYQVRGPGTKWLAQCSAGDTINLLGPLGNGFTIPKDSQKPAILIGGGVGLPPMFFLADQLAKLQFKKVTAFAGGRTKNHFEGIVDSSISPSKQPLRSRSILEQFKRSNTGCVIATDDGSLGFHGNVVGALDNFLESQSGWDQAQLYACGPEGMLKAIAQLAQRRNMDCQVCMEAYMACGIGICQSCVVAVRDRRSAASSKSVDDKKQYKLVCTNGPVFDAKTIIWEQTNNHQ